MAVGIKVLLCLQFQYHKLRKKVEKLAFSPDQTFVVDIDILITNSRHDLVE